MANNESYVCSVCGEEVLIEQTIYDKYDLDHKCLKCYSQQTEG